jgi:hypothetical protein
MLIMPPPAFSPTFPDFFFDISGRRKKRYQKPQVSDYFFFDITKRDKKRWPPFFFDITKKDGITFSSTSQKKKESLFLRHHKKRQHRRICFFFDIIKKDEQIGLRGAILKLPLDIHLAKYLQNYTLQQDSALA